jgi:hypothetical protein
MRRGRGARGGEGEGQSWRCERPSSEWHTKRQMIVGALTLPLVLFAHLQHGAQADKADVMVIDQLSRDRKRRREKCGVRPLRHSAAAAFRTLPPLAVPSEWPSLLP